MALPETAPSSVPTAAMPTALDEKPTGASGTRLKVATRPATVGATWLELFQPGTPSSLGLDARVRVVADIAGALIQIHENSGVPRQHRRHGRVTPRHVLIGVDGSASLFNAKEPFSKLLPPQPDLGYLAPELLTQSGPATQQSDIFSMGVLLWEALDNGRLFPHRRAASISRLIARRSLPNPRIEEEWALPLAAVAMIALSDSPDERYADATALWLALREHLPPPDNARAALSGQAQRALRLELTSDIREIPPYLVPSKLLFNNSVPPERGNPADAAAVEASARYSLRPEPSSRQTGNSLAPTSAAPEPLNWALSEPPRSTARAAAHGGARYVSQPPRSEPPSSRASSPPPSSQATPTRRAVSQPPPSASPPPVSTLQVNLPRDLVDASLPLYVSSQPPQRPFPWGALSFAALIFFGVGAAVAFGAVTALRGPATVLRETVTERRPFEAQAQPVAATPTPPVAVPAPAPPRVTEGQLPPVQPDPHATASAASAETRDLTAVNAARAGGSEPAHVTIKRARAPKPKPHEPKPQPAPDPSPAAKPESPTEALPFVEQPY